MLSCLPDCINDQPQNITAGAIFSINSDPKLVKQIKHGYRVNPWCAGILNDMKRNMLDTKLNISLKHRLLFIGNRLLIPKYMHLHEHLFQMAHDNLGHFGSEKLYASLHDDFYWLNMQKNLTSGYVVNCPDCQQNKSGTAKVAGPLHPLPVPGAHFESMVIDFVGPLPKDDEFDAIVTMTDHLGADVQIVPCTTTITTKEFAYLFFDKWYCKNGCPVEIISDRNKIFISKFW